MGNKIYINAVRKDYGNGIEFIKDNILNFRISRLKNVNEIRSYLKENLIYRIKITLKKQIDENFK